MKVMDVKLHIDTTDRNLTTVSLEKGGRVLGKLSREREYGSQALLPLITELCIQCDVALQDLSSVAVETGQGSFTGIRVGVSVANALGFALNIPVNGKDIETDVKYA